MKTLLIIILALIASACVDATKARTAAALTATPMPTATPAKRKAKPKPTETPVAKCAPPTEGSDR